MCRRLEHAASDVNTDHQKGIYSETFYLPLNHVKDATCYNLVQKIKTFTLPSQEALQTIQYFVAQ